jgi:exonuclease VII small subunit
MSSHQTLNQSINTMVEVLEAMKGEKLSLDETMNEFSKAIESYQSCQNYLSNEKLDVKEVKIEIGEFVESNFDWQGM